MTKLSEYRRTNASKTGGILNILSETGGVVHVDDNRTVYTQSVVTRSVGVDDGLSEQSRVVVW